MAKSASSTDIMQQSEAQVRLVWMDLARLIAVYCVVAIHVASVPVVNMKAVPLHWWWWANAYNSICQAAVPLFVMLSGASLLTQHPWDMRRFFARRAAKLLVPLIGWTLIYAVWQGYLDHDRIYIRTHDIIRNLVDGLNKPSASHLWFLWVIVSLYLLTPMLRPFVVLGSSGSQLYFGILWFVVTALLPLFEGWSGLHVGLQLEMASGFIGYYVLGGSLHRLTPTRLSVPWIIISWLLFGLSAVGTAWGTHVLNKGKGAFNESLWEASAGNVIVMSFAAFLLIRHYGARLVDGNPETAKWRTWLVWASSLSFGIYLSHQMILDLLDLAGLTLDPLIRNPAWYVPLVTTLSFMLAGIFTVLVRAIPCLNRLMP
jgi:surface polysaccharide O-acyltransferase-like enzyme